MIFSGVTIGQNDLLGYAIDKIRNGFPFSLVDNLEKLTKKIFDLSSTNRDLNNMVWGV